MSKRRRHRSHCSESTPKFKPQGWYELLQELGHNSPLKWADLGPAERSYAHELIDLGCAALDDRGQLHHKKPPDLQVCR